LFLFSEYGGQMAPNKFVVMKLRFLRHFDTEFALGDDPHQVGSRMAGRYVLRIIQLVHTTERCGGIVSDNPVRLKEFLRALDKMVETKRGISNIIRNAMDLTVPPADNPAETIEQVPPGAMRADVRAVLDLIDEAHAEHAGPGKRSKAQWYLDDLYREVQSIATDLAIDSAVYPMKKPEVTAELLNALLDAWLEMRAVVIGVE
jgi:hypothetical protein